MNYIASDKIHTFTDLKAWQHAHGLVIAIYETTRYFPKEEIFGLTSQIRRAAVSITSNIAEGFSRQTFAEKVQFYSIAQGSHTELQNQLLIARDIKYLTNDNFTQLSGQSLVVHRLLNGLIKKTKMYRSS